MTLPQPGAQHVYQAPPASKTKTQVEELARLIAGLMIEVAYGDGSDFTMTTLGTNGTSIGFECTLPRKRVIWEGVIKLFRDGVMANGATFFPKGKNDTDPYTLKMQFTEREGPVYYYQITNQNGKVLRSFGIERQ